MRPALLPALVAAAIAASAFGARAQEADCDLMCRLQSYIGRDHMTDEPAGSGAGQAVRPEKHHALAARKPRPAPPAASAIATPRPVKPVAEIKTPAAAPAPAKPGPVKAAAVVPPPKHRAADTPKPTTPPIAAPPPVVATATPETRPAPRREAHAGTSLRRHRAPVPFAAAPMIPGSARMVPAEFQRFGTL